MRKFILVAWLCFMSFAAHAQSNLPIDQVLGIGNCNAGGVPASGGNLRCTGNNFSAPLSYFASSADVNNQIASLGRAINRQSEGVALSIAQSRTTNLAEGKTFALSLGFGGFQGQTSAGFGAVGKVDNHVYLSAGWGVGLNSGVVGGGGAVSFQW